MAQDWNGATQHTYKVWHNVSSHYMRGYQDGDTLVGGWEGTSPLFRGDTSNGVLDRLFYTHNADTRPDGQTAPSLSVGDVLVVNGVAYTVMFMGWKQVTLDKANLVQPHEGERPIDAISREWGLA